MDVVHVVRVDRINTVNRTDVNAACVLHIDARFNDHVGHRDTSSQQANAAYRRLSLRTPMSETATFPLPFDATLQDRDAAKKEFAKYTHVLGEEERAITIA